MASSIDGVEAHDAAADGAAGPPSIAIVSASAVAIRPGAPVRSPRPATGRHPSVQRSCPMSSVSTATATNSNVR